MICTWILFYFLSLYTYFKNCSLKRNFLLSQNLIFVPIHVVPKHYFSIWSYTTYTFEKPLRGFSINPELIIRLRNHYVVSLVKRLRNHYVVTQNDPILLIRLKTHCMVSQFNPILFIRLRNYYVVSQKTMHLRIWTTLFLGSFVGDGNGENLNGSFNFSTANFCRGKNQYKILRKICSPHWKSLKFILSIQVIDSKKMIIVFLVI